MVALSSDLPPSLPCFIHVEMMIVSKEDEEKRGG